MREPTKTQLVFGDLCQLYVDINKNRRNPRFFRLAFESYVFKSQQLTEAMRSEYKQQTGKKWCASDFDGWNEYTNSVKKIRNAALHGYPIVLDEAVLSIYPNLQFSIDAENEDLSPKKYRAVIGRSFIPNPFSEVFCSGGFGYQLKEIVSADPASPENYEFPIKEYVFYELRWDLLDLGVFSDIGKGKRVDAIKLVLKSFPTFERYMQYYEKELEGNRCNAYKPDFWVKSESGLGWVINPKYQEPENKT